MELHEGIAKLLKEPKQRELHSLLSLCREIVDNLDVNAILLLIRDTRFC